MNPNKNLFDHLSEWWQTRRERPHTAKWNRWLPTPGNILFTLLMIGLLILTQRAWANNSPNSVNTPGPSATTINYQGRLADSSGNPINGNRTIQFAIYDATSGGNVVWGAETHANVPVTDGLFNVGLGSLTPGGIPTTVWNGDRYLQITVNGEALSPRELIRSVPIAGMALTVPDGAITQSSAPTLLKVAASQAGGGQNWKVQTGNWCKTLSAGDYGSVSITFPEAFSQPPIVFAEANSVQVGNTSVHVSVLVSPSPTQSAIYVYSGAAQTICGHWMALGR